MKMHIPDVAHLDMFGMPAGFIIEGGAKFKTNVGGFCTLVFLGMFFYTMLYFIHRLFAKEDPVLTYNKFDSTDWLNEDLIAHDFHVHWVPIDTRTGKPYPLDRFWGSFTITGCTFDAVYTDDGKGSRDIKTTQGWLYFFMANKILNLN